MKTPKQFLKDQLTQQAPALNLGGIGEIIFIEYDLPIIDFYRHTDGGTEYLSTFDVIHFITEDQDYWKAKEENI